MGEVIYVDFSRKKREPVVKRRSKGIGAFIKPPGCASSAYILGGNVAGFIDSWIAFHEDFDPAKYGIDERAERGVNMNHEPEPDGPDAA